MLGDRYFLRNLLVWRNFSNSFSRHLMEETRRWCVRRHHRDIDVSRVKIFQAMVFRISNISCKTFCDHISLLSISELFPIMDMKINFRTKMLTYARSRLCGSHVTKMISANKGAPVCLEKSQDFGRCRLLPGTSFAPDDCLLHTLNQPGSGRLS